MEWVLEQDVLYMLLHLMGQIPSLGEALNLAEADVPIASLRSRAVELGLAEVTGSDIIVDPELRVLLEQAADAVEVIEVITASGESDDLTAQYYYVGPKGIVRVRREAQKLSLDQASRARAVEGLLRELQIKVTKPQTDTIVVPLPSPDEPPGDALTTEGAWRFLQLMRTAALSWVLRLMDGQIHNALLVAVKDGQAWVLRHQEQALVMQPLARAEVRAGLVEVFGAAPEVHSE